MIFMWISTWIRRLPVPISGIKNKTDRLWLYPEAIRFFILILVHLFCRASGGHDIKVKVFRVIGIIE